MADYMESEGGTPTLDAFVQANLERGVGEMPCYLTANQVNNYIREGVPRLAIDTSNGQVLQEALPNSHVIKAFNTLSTRQMIDPASSGGPVSIPLAGNDDAAKATVAELVAGMGLEPVDVGPIENAHFVEGMLVLWMYGRVTGQPFDFHLRRTGSQ
jgi:predicted dinucleotide-binding enzyme